MQITGAEALVRQLALEGVTDVFGVPGLQLDFALDALVQHTPEIRFFGTRHEQAAAYMADGYARTTGDVGVCMVVPGPGVLNAGAALATAFACSSRVLCIAGQIPSWAIGQDLGLLHEIRDQSHLLQSLTKWSAIATSPEEVPGLIHEAFRQLRSGRPRPVSVEIPPDVLAATGDIMLVDPSTLTPTPRDSSDQEAIGRIESYLSAATAPAIYVGGGAIAAAAERELLELAERLDAPIILSRGGRGAVSDRHHLAVSNLAGRRLLEEADVVLVVGSRFITSMGDVVQTKSGAILLGVNAEPSDLLEPRNYLVSVVGDARETVAAISATVTEGQSRPDWLDSIAAARNWADGEIAALEPLSSWLDAVRAGIPDDGVLVSELTQVGYLATVGYPVFKAGSYIAPGYQGTLGYGFPTALGAKVAAGARAVVSITGDGGFGWGLSELATAKKYGIALVTVVFNDSAFGNVRRIQAERFEERYIASTLVNPDFLKLADAFEIDAVRVSDPASLTAAIEKALANNAPALIEVPVGEMPSPWPLVIDGPIK
ncbi:thiamine pyrophosphate-binding protein [Arthrobacter sp. StoSoilB22]|uniref:thiamine pyrophosphate-binding protein n=1 Tax=Arthrobacter sp. StoSoilB22 TaxID=2830996 RepID=UPI001CC6CB32|nr:thiamine pyrophosphate-binding protein [Arthrobacter sp. StoSoilB22]BCW62870.1 thiamine pyrophosphate enzyme [Arthrobacter sp. StoSoilB22]